jgi:hypothetical protein
MHGRLARLKPWQRYYLVAEALYLLVLLAGLANWLLLDQLVSGWLSLVVFLALFLTISETIDRRANEAFQDDHPELSHWFREMPWWDESRGWSLTPILIKVALRRASRAVIRPLTARVVRFVIWAGQGGHSS